MILQTRLCTLFTLFLLFFAAQLNAQSNCSNDVTPPVWIGCPKDTVIETIEPGLVSYNWVSPQPQDDCGLRPGPYTFDELNPNFSGTRIVSYVATDLAGNQSVCKFLVSIKRVTSADCTNNLLPSPNFRDWFGANFVRDANNTDGSICNSGGRTYYWTNAAPGKSYNFAFDGRTNGISANAFVSIKFMNLSFVTVASESKTVLLSSQDQNFTISATAPAQTAFVEVSVLKTAGADCIYLTDACLNDGNQPEPSPCVNDLVAPTLFCSFVGTPLVFLTNDTIARASWFTYSSTDNCQTTALTASHYPFQYFPLGNTTVTYTATDASNNQTSCSFQVQVINPQVQNQGCTNNIAANPGFESGGVNYWFSGPGRSSISLIKPNDQEFQLCNTSSIGQYIRIDTLGTYTCRSQVYTTGNTTQISQRIQYFSINWEPLGTTSVSHSATGTEQTFSISAIAPIGSYYLSFWVQQLNESDCVFVDDFCVSQSGGLPSFNFCNGDIVPPVISNCPSDQNVFQLSATWNHPVMSFSDNCNIFSASWDKPTGTPLSPGLNTATFTVRDQVGNVSYCVYNVQVEQQSADCSQSVLKNGTFDTDSLLYWNVTGSATLVPEGTGKSVSTQNASFYQPIYVGGVFTQSSGFILTYEVGSAVSTNEFVAGVYFLDQSFNRVGTPVLDQNFSTSAQMTSRTLKFNAPQGAIIAEIRFTNPTTNAIRVDNVCLSTNQQPIIPCSVDKEAPIIIDCPKELRIQTNQTALSVKWMPITAKDECSPTTLTATKNSGDVFLRGTTPVVFTAKDNAGNTSSCTFSVVLEAPVASQNICTNNIARNGDFENIAQIGNWQGFYALGDNGVNGSKGIDLCVGGHRVYQQSVADANKVYQVRFMARANVAALNLGVSIKFFDENWQVIYSNYLTVSANNQFQAYQLSALAPLGSRRMEFVIQNPSFNNCIYIDDICVTAETAQPLQSSNSPLQDTDNEIVEDFTIFPNPAQSYLLISMEPFVQETVVIRIVNHLGQVVHQEQTEKLASAIHQIDLSHLHNGQYFVQIQSPMSRPVTRKLVIAKLD
jgi:hypothetical protein